MATQPASVRVVSIHRPEDDDGIVLAAWIGISAVVGGLLAVIAMVVL